MTNQPQNPKMATFHDVIFLISPPWSVLERSWNSLARSRPLLSQLVVKSCVELIFHTAPSVPLQAGVKFEHLVYPLGVEGNIDEERGLRRGAFCPLDAHADDDFALMFLANQWTAVVFLQRKG